MKTSPQIREVFVGIDVAFAKKKRLPICVCEVHGKNSRRFLYEKTLTSRPQDLETRHATSISRLETSLQRHWLSGWTSCKATWR